MRFEEIYGRFQRGRLSVVEAAVWLGVSERRFRRQRGRFAAEGPGGLLARRPGPATWPGGLARRLGPAAWQGERAPDRGGRGRADRGALPGSLCGVAGEALPRAGERQGERQGQWAARAWGKPWLDQASYGWTKQAMAGPRTCCTRRAWCARQPGDRRIARGGPRRPVPGMMLHQSLPHGLDPWAFSPRT